MSVLPSSHEAARLEQEADTITALDRGRIVAQGSPSKIAALTGIPHVLFLLVSPADAFPLPEDVLGLKFSVGARGDHTPAPEGRSSSPPIAITGLQGPVKFLDTTAGELEKPILSPMAIGPLVFRLSEQRWSAAAEPACDSGFLESGIGNGRLKAVLCQVRTM